MTKLTPAVTFICRVQTHLAAAEPHGTLTVNGVAWAFCPSSLVSDHEWSALERPIEVYELRRDWRPFAADQELTKRAGAQTSERPLSSK